MFYFHQSSAVGTQTDSTSTMSQSVQTEGFGVQSTLLAPSCVANLQAMSIAFSKHCNDALNIDIPGDFLEVAAYAMVTLKQAQRSNVVYNLAKGVGTQRQDHIDSRFPVSRMPMGLVEYITNFLLKTSTQ